MHKHQAKNKKSIVKETYNFVPVIDLLKSINNQDQFNIDFYGFHYKAASLIPLPTIDKDLEKLRFKILEKEFTWLSHEKLQDQNYYE